MNFASATTAAAARLGLLLLLFAALLAGCARDEVEAQPGPRELAQYKQAVQLLREDSLQHAISILKDLLESTPDFEQGWRTLSEAAQRSGNYPDVMRAQEWILKRYPEETTALALLAHAALADGQPDHAHETLKRLHRLESDKGRTQVLWTRLYLELGEMDLAATHAGRAVRLSPTEVLPHYVLALASEEEGDVEGAIENLRKVVALDPGHRGARDRLALLLLESGNRKEAGRQREIHTAITRAMPGAFRLLSPEIRLENFEPLLELLPEWHVPQLEIGRAQMDLGQLTNARRTLRGALKYAGNSTDVHELLAQVLERMGDFESAAKHRSQAPTPWDESKSTP